MARPDRGRRAGALLLGGVAGAVLAGGGPADPLVVCRRDRHQLECSAGDIRYQGWVGRGGEIVLHRPGRAALSGHLDDRRAVLRAAGDTLACWVTADGRRWHCRPER